MYNGEKHLIESMLQPGHVIFEGENKNLIVYKESDMTNEKFSYKSSKHGWVNDYTGNYMIGGDFKVGANVNTEEYNSKIPAQKWYL
jgi:hypothetical protein